MKTKKIMNVVMAAIMVTVGSFVFCGATLSKTVTLKVWTSPGYLQGIWAQYITPKYETAHPQIKLEFLEVPEKELERKYYISLQARKAPDVIFLMGESFGDYVHAGALAPMPEDLQREFWDSGVVSHFRKIFSYKGKTYALSRNIGPYLLHYNKTMFAEAGLTAPPMTWDEFITAAKKTSKYDKKGEIERVGYAIRHVGGIPGSVGKFLPFVYSAGGDFMEPEEKKALFNSPAGQHALQLYVDLIWKYRVSSLEFPDPRDSFVEGLAAMQISETIESRLNRDAPELRYGLALVPAVAGKESETVFDCNLSGVSPQSKHQKEAWEFLLWERTAEWVKDRILMMGDTVPLRSKTAGDPEIKEINFIRLAMAALPGAHPYPIAPNFREVCGIFWSYVQKALYEKMTVEDALVEAEKKANEALARW